MASNEMKKMNPLLSLFIDFFLSHTPKKNVVNLFPFRCLFLLLIHLLFLLLFSLTNFHGYAVNECNGFIFGTWAIIIIAIVNA